MITNPTVSVIMITYGQENYIRQAIEGVLMQECNFEFELIIANDSSPDNTSYIIKDVLSKHKSSLCVNFIDRTQNVGMQVNFIEALNVGRGKYIAVCEGDDFWTDSLKLQKQIDFLEANPDFIMCTHNYSVYNQSSESLNMKNKFESSIEYDLNAYFDDHYTPTLTSCWRNIFKDYSLLKKGKWFSDYYLFFEILKHGKGYFIVDNMATYRVSDIGVCSGLTEDIKILNHILMLEELVKFNPALTVVKKHLARYNLIYFNYLIRIAKVRRLPLKYLNDYYKSETNLSRLLKTTFVGLPFYIVRYIIPNQFKYKQS